MKKKIAFIALCLAAAIVPSVAMALPKIQCGPGGAALIYYYNSDGSVNHTVWVSQHAMCV